MTDVYLEVGKRRTFASALEWPGWTRAGRHPESALAALGDYRPRYAAVLRAHGIPSGPDGDLHVVETLEGDATTDFGAPSRHPEADHRSLDGEEADRLLTLLRACWEDFDRTAAVVSGPLRKGPRGGGRDLPAVIAHVVGADRAYAARLGARPGPVQPGDPEAVAVLRRLIEEAVRHPLDGRWTPRYAVRRSAWHALDHAWEIEDRSDGAPPKVR